MNVYDLMNELSIYNVERTVEVAVDGVSRAIKDVRLLSDSDDAAVFILVEPGPDWSSNQPPKKRKPRSKENTT